MLNNNYPFCWNSKPCLKPKTEYHLLFSNMDIKTRTWFEQKTWEKHQSYLCWFLVDFWLTFSPGFILPVTLPREAVHPCQLHGQAAPQLKVQRKLIDVTVSQLTNIFMHHLCTSQVFENKWRQVMFKTFTKTDYATCSDPRRRFWHPKRANGPSSSRSSIQLAWPVAPNTWLIGLARPRYETKKVPRQLGLK